MKLHIINGPNLNLLGKREPEIYGSLSMDEALMAFQSTFPTVEIGFYQSNVEGEIINELQRVMNSVQGIIINPGGYSHTSVAIADAIRAVTVPVLEVHLSNIYSREVYRHQSITGAECQGVISGLGMAGYALAIRWFVERRNL